MSDSTRTFRPLALSLTILGVLGRFAPHPANFTPVGAASLFAGARLRGWQAYLIPLATMTLTDPILAAFYGFAPFSRITPLIYGCFLINVFIGRRLRASEGAGRIGIAAFLCSLQFFLVTNFATWLGSGLYPRSWAGLAACYTAALPFFGRTLAGDLFYSGVLFGLHAWLSRTLFEPERVWLRHPTK